MRSATAEGMTNADLTASPRLIKYMVEIAKSGVELIITDLTKVTKDESGTPLSLAIYNDTFITSLTQMTNVVHETNI